MQPDIMFGWLFVEDPSTFVSMLGQFEQQPLYNAMNFSRSIYSGVNSTVYAAGLATLWCPSDGQIAGKRMSFGPYGDNPNLTVAYTSYAGCTGTWHPEILVLLLRVLSQPDDIVLAASVDRQQHERCLHLRRPDEHRGDHRRHEQHPALRREGQRPVHPERLATATTGGGSVSADTNFTTLYPINAFKKIARRRRRNTTTPGPKAPRASTRAGPISPSPTARSTSSRIRSARWPYNPPRAIPSA